MADQLHFQNVSAYKYRTLKSFIYAQKHILPEKDIIHPLFSITSEGIITIEMGYAWDGPTGPVFSERTVIKSTLVHDALYQMMRLRMLPLSARKGADRVFRDICVEDGMSKTLANFYYQCLRVFGEKYAAMQDDPPKSQVL